MEKNINPPSLYPYLDSKKNNFNLKISLLSDNAAFPGKAPFPFLIISDSHPLSLLIEGRFTTDAGSEVKKVFLFLQRDQYTLKKEELSLTNNREIEKAWQKTFSFYSHNKHHIPLITLSRQIDQSGQLVPFQSLFFCKEKQLFFNPLCSECGLPIQLCDNDDQLLSLGLKAYSTSLKRYLYCPSCFAATGRSDFYVYELEQSDPPFLKDRWHLIKAFAVLFEKKTNAKNFPCLTCVDNKNCYRTNEEFASKIVPFSFYPFFLLIFEDMTLNSQDFLSLISGATFEELEDELEANGELGRVSCLQALKKNCCGRGLFFSEGDERCFPEILYLKLTFLAEFIRETFSSGPDFFNNPNMQLSLDRIWIKLTEYHGLLPSFWDFKVKDIDLMKGPYESHTFPSVPTSFGLYFFGFIWFYSLLVNKKQNITQIYFSLGKLMQEGKLPHQFPAPIITEDPMVSYLPENIFWLSEEKTISEKWRPLWEKSLNLGWSLFTSSFHSEEKWSKELFCQKLEALREEVKNTLFQGETDLVYPHHSTKDKVIYDILLKIMDKWSIETEPKKKSYIAEIKPQEKETQKLDGTMIIFPSNPQKEVSSHESKTNGKEIEKLDETVIISPTSTQKEVLLPELKTNVKEKEKEKEREELEETVIISPTGSYGKATTPKKNGAEVQGLSSSPTLDPKEGKMPPAEPEDDFFKQTIILRPEATKDEEEK